MALFQEAIIKKHLSLIDEQIIDAAFSEYKRVYSPDKIKNIRVAKEEQYQEGFIKDVFGSVLGYSVYPEHPYNIETEKKNELSARRASTIVLLPTPPGPEMTKSLPMLDIHLPAIRRNSDSF